MKTLSLIFLLICTTSVLTSAQTLTADEIIQKHLTAIGGSDKIGKITSIVMEGKYNMGQGLEAPIKTYIIPEKAVRQEFSLQGQTMIQVVEGNGGWVISPFDGNKNAEHMPEEDVKRQQTGWDITGGLYNYAQRKCVAEYFGMDDFEGADVHKIRITLPTGQMIYHYIDAENFMDINRMLKIKLGDKEIKYHTSYSNFVASDYGVIMPMNLDGQTTITKVAFNVPIDPSLFVMPPKSSPTK